MFPLIEIGIWAIVLNAGLMLALRAQKARADDARGGLGLSGTVGMISAIASVVVIAGMLFGFGQ